MVATIDALREALRGRGDVSLAVLFGSEARGTAGPDSDVDVAILGDADELRLGAELSLVTGREVSVVRLDDPPVPLLAAIVRDGLVVHESRRGQWAAFRAHAWTTLETDLPWWRRMADAEMRRIAAGTRWSTKT